MQVVDQKSSTGFPAKIKKVNSLWFEDGNIVVIAKDTGFRIHKSVLAKHSVVFRDMFAISSRGAPNLGVEQDEIDGVPAVYLQGDSSNDVTHFLRVLYDWTFLYDHATSLISFDVLSGLLRISTKYMVYEIRRAVIDKMRSMYPGDDQLQGSSGEKVIRFDGQEFAYFKLAREMNVNSVLPRLYYAVCSHPLDVIKDQLGGLETSCVWSIASGREKMHAIESRRFRLMMLSSGIVDHPRLLVSVLRLLSLGATQNLYHFFYEYGTSWSRREGYLRDLLYQVNQDKRRV